MVYLLGKNLDPNFLTSCFNVSCNTQKQPFADVLQNMYSWQFHNIHRKTHVLESLFNKVAGLQSTGVFLWILGIFKSSFFIEHLRCPPSVSCNLNPLMSGDNKKVKLKTFRPGFFRLCLELACISNQFIPQTFEYGRQVKKTFFNALDGRNGKTPKYPKIFDK